MSKKYKKGKAIFDAQNWLFREFLDKMKRNNVKSILCFTKDKYGEEKCFNYCVSKKQTKVIRKYFR